MSSSIEILRQFYVLQILLEQNACQVDLARLTACNKAFLDARRHLLYNSFTLTLKNLESYEFAIDQGARRVRLFGNWISKYHFDFEKRERRLLAFVCFDFNQLIESFGSLMHFECFYFNQRIDSFGSLNYFESGYFNQPIKSFGSLKHFECARFNQPINSFDLLQYFLCMQFNQPINSFDSLQHFQCIRFNQPIKSFGTLKNFECYYFNQTIKSFESLKQFTCANDILMLRWLS